MSAHAMTAANAAAGRANGAAVIDARGMHYRELNRCVREAAAQGVTSLELVNVNGQRYIGTGLAGDLRLDVHGVPGNDLAAFMDGPTIVVHGNAQDGIGNTMNAGAVIIAGDGGDLLGYGMRGGKLFVRGDVHYRVGIHMKAYKSQLPMIVVGGRAGDFLGEYMAGGLLIVLGLTSRSGAPLVGAHCATGIHGGEIILRGEVSVDRIARAHARVAPATDAQLKQIRPHIAEFCAHFGYDLEKVMSAPFQRVTPFSHRPFGDKYAL